MEASEDEKRWREYIEKTLPDNMVNFSIAALIWLFGVLVFMPMAKRIDPKMHLLCSVIIFSAFTVFLTRGLQGFGKTLNNISELLAREWMRKREGAEEPDGNMIRKCSIGLKMATTVMIYLFYYPVLKAIHPSINGIAVILMILTMIFILIKREK